MTLEQFREKYYPSPYNFTEEVAKEFERTHGLSLYKEVDLVIEMDYKDRFPPKED